MAMVVHKLVAAFGACATLVAVAVAPPGAAVASTAPAAIGVAASGGDTGSVGTTTQPPPFAPCPLAAIPNVPKPPAPTYPQADPDAPVVGGIGLATAGLTVPAGATIPPAAKLSAHSWVVADLDTGAVLGACAPHVRHPPASVQKLLLVDTVLPKLDTKQVITITQPDLDFEQGSSAVGLLLGGRYTVDTLFLGLMLNSGNDAANVLARLGGGSAGVAGTLTEMNARAHELGALDTHAVTPSGLDGPGQSTSAYDLALIARDAFQLPDFRRYVATTSAQMPPQPPKDPRGFQIQNDNQLLYDYPGALGGKTGFTDLARHTYVGLAQRGGRRLVVTILDAESVPGRGWQQGAALLDWGFSLPKDASVGRLVGRGELDHPAPSASVPPAAARQAVTGPGARELPDTDLVLAIAVGMIALLGLVVAAIAVARLRRHRDGQPGA